MKRPFSAPRREGPRQQYEVLGLLAQGGFSRVFLARQPNGMHVVIKKPWGYRTERDEGRHGQINPYGIAVEKLNIEASFLKAAIGKRGVVDFLDLFYEGDAPCLVMRFVDGPSLREYVASRRAPRQTGGLGLEEALRVFEQVLDIIRFVHNVTDKVHRDITPNNVIMEDSQAVMIDFGTISEDKGVSEEVHTGIQAGGYHAPEQTQGASAKICDIYSLGSTIYFLLTGKDPPQPTVRNPTDRVMTHELQKVSVPDELISIVMKARAFSPSARFPTVDDLRNAVLTFRDPSRVQCMVCDSPMHVASVTCRNCGATRCDICGDFSQKDQTTCSCGANFCPACSVANLPQAVYCRFCGQSLRDRVACPSCGRQTPISAIFCKFCGSRVAPAT
ncbi:MAG: protein kinase [Thermoplasmata archaeon]